MENVHEIFVNVQKNYNEILRVSIDKDADSGSLKYHGNPIFYNYLILDGSKLYNILDCYKNCLTPINIQNYDLDSFKDSCIYVGKGKDNRKFQHAICGKKIIEGHLIMSKLSEKFSTITKLWNEGLGVVILQLFNETTHQEAHAREYALIKALSLNNITNVVNGTTFGDMKNNWNKTEIANYGNMILYNALKMCIHEPPRIIQSKDVILPKPRKNK